MTLGLRIICPRVALIPTSHPKIIVLEAIFQASFTLLEMLADSKTSLGGFGYQMKKVANHIGMCNVSLIGKEIILKLPQMGDYWVINVPAKE
jgi:hypothetical protein